MRAQPREPLVLQLAGTVTRADKQASDYRLVPFDVPPGAQRLRVEYAYAGNAPAAEGFGERPVLDIGAFDPRGSAFLAGQGFRGWSGGARSAFEIGPFEATPGYLPGPIHPGRWQILLGLYRIPSAGCRYEITITLSFEPMPAPAPQSACPDPPRSAQARWYAGDLHNHTHHSDAVGSLAELAAAARTWGLDFIAVTEHNTTSHIPLLGKHQADGLLLIPGQEITTYYGHANSWGTTGWYDFRCRDAGDMARVAHTVHAAGSLFSINHPQDKGSPWTYGLLELADCVEVWQGPWLPHNAEALALWDGELARGHRVVGVGGSDNHQGLESHIRAGRHIGLPTTWVHAEALTPAAILAGIRAGHVMIAQGAAGPWLYLEADADGDGRYEAMMGDEICVRPGAMVRWRCRAEGAEGLRLRWVSPGGEAVLPVTAARWAHHWEAQAAQDGYLRAELLAGEDEDDASLTPRLALTNPIYLRVS